MLSLSLDTALENLSIALVQEEEILANYFSLCPRRNATILLNVIQELLTNNRRTLTDVDRLIVTIGPGSFTGLRIGMSVLKTIAQVIQQPIFPVNTLQLLAMQVFEQNSSFPVYLNCTRSEVFYVNFLHEKGIPQQQGEIQRTILEDIPESIRKQPGIYKRIPKQPFPTLEALPRLPQKFPTPDAYLLFQAAQQLEICALDYTKVQPLYLKQEVTRSVQKKT